MVEARVRASAYYFANEFRNRRAREPLRASWTCLTWLLSVCLCGVSGENRGFVAW